MNDANKGNKLVSFTYGDAQRIARVVQENERGRRGRKPSSLPRAAGSGGGSFERATFVGSWFRGADKVVTLQAGGTNTAVAVNLLMDIVGNGATRNCIVGTVDGDYALISSEC